MIDDYPSKLELRDKRIVTIRIATREDEERLVLFFLAIPEYERNFLRYDVTDHDGLQGWFAGPSWEDFFPLIAEIEGCIVGVGVLRGYRTPWITHNGEFWMIVSPNLRGFGLGRILANEMFGLATELGMEKLLAEMRADHLFAIKIFKQLGYSEEGMLTNYVKDQDGQTYDLVIMACNVKDYLRRSPPDSIK
ncbi:MAG: GNAT family N-acetyltransferase [Chloroflexota bacterium]